MDMDMDMGAGGPGAGPGPSEPAAATGPEPVGHPIREELIAEGVTLLNDGVPSDPSEVRRVEIPIGTAVSHLIDELRSLPSDAVFAEAFGDADIVAVFYPGSGPGRRQAAG